MTWDSPVVLIGLDAATWDVIDPLLARGQLPNIASLMHDGSWGCSKSFLDYASPSLWTSIITGKLPAKHGVLGFYGATRHHVQCRTLYDILEGNSGRTGLFRWFATWPPTPSAGFTVPSSIARSPETYPPQLTFLNDLVHPKGLASYLRGGMGLLKYGARPGTLAQSMTEVIYQALARPGYREWLWRGQLLEARIYGDVFAHLLKRYQPQFAAVLFSIIDSFGHQYWKYREPELFDGVSKADVQKYGEVIDSAYIMADQALGVILNVLPEDALVIVASDHGQHAAPTRNRPYLMTENLLKKLGFHKAAYMTHLGYKTVIQSRSLDNQSGNLEALAQGLDRIRLLKDNLPVFRIIAQTRTELEVEVCLDTDTRIDVPVSLPNGEQVQLGDIVLSRTVTGVHAEWGVLILKGPGVKIGHRLDNVTILDVTPTILALRGYPVGEDMDGQVLVDGIEPGFLRQNPVRFIETYDSEPCVVEEAQLSQQEQEALEAKLRGLGYL